MGICVSSWFVLFLSLFFFKSSSGEAPEVVTVDVKAAKHLIESGYAYYLDVRTVEEFKKGHVDVVAEKNQKILNIPYVFNTPQGRVKNPEFLKEVTSVCKEDDRLIVGCQSGVRSWSAAADLLESGFKNVNNMGGGYLAWVENRFPFKVDLKPEEKPKEEQQKKEL